jgi:hypothetical protein
MVSIANLAELIIFVAKSTKLIINEKIYFCNDCKIIFTFTASTQKNEGARTDSMKYFFGGKLALYYNEPDKYWKNGVGYFHFALKPGFILGSNNLIGLKFGVSP